MFYKCTDSRVGDAGGYMGLLIGASCLTLCEVLDLFLYNCFLKIMDRYKRRRIAPVMDLEKGKSIIGDSNYHYWQDDNTDGYFAPLPKITDWYQIQ